MTKVELHYKLAHRVEDHALLDAIARLHGVYGVLRVILSPTLDALTVEYDASRLTTAEVEEILRQQNLPIESASGFAA